MFCEAEPAKKRKGIYKYVVKEEVVFKHVPIKYPFKKEFLEITDGGYIIIHGACKNGYAWDGCTPKFNIFDLWVVGVPDGRILVDSGKPTTYYASMVHDILCQYQKEIGISRKQADDIFLYYLGDFQLRYVYYAVARFYSNYLKVSEKLAEYANKAFKSIHKMWHF